MILAPFLLEHSFWGILGSSSVVTAGRRVSGPSPLRLGVGVGNFLRVRARVWGALVHKTKQHTLRILCNLSMDLTKEREKNEQIRQISLRAMGQSLSTVTPR